MKNAVPRLPFRLVILAALLSLAAVTPAAFADGSRAPLQDTFVHSGAPYCLLTFTGGDTLVDKEQVKTFTRALREKGVKYDLIYKDYYSHNGFNDTDLFEPMVMKMLITAQEYL